jgi:hypothetical protein
MSDDSEDDNALSFSQATLDEVPEEEPTPPLPKRKRRLPSHEAATNELYMHEMLALLSCFIFPMLGAYLLHTLRSQLTRPSEGLVSNYNLTIFLLASELRPMAHLVKLIQSRTLHLQRVVNANPHDNSSGRTVGDVKDFARRLEELEAQSSSLDTSKTRPEPVINAKQSAVLVTEVRRSLQPDLDALNRAVRRYEKRATIQAFQTEARLHELEGRLNDAISLAAAAVKNSQHQRGFTTILIEWAATTVVLPVQALTTVAALPLRLFVVMLNYGRAKVKAQPVSDRERRTANGNGRYSLHSRSGDRTRAAKKQPLM